jgi:pimeloyl-ACP methyl ester carboxylesterase
MAQQFMRMVAPLADLPCCVVWGEADPYLPARFALQQREAFPKAEVHLLPQSGHFPFADDPQGVAEVVVPFMRRVVASATP